MTIPYKISYFLIFSTIPFMLSILLLFIRFLFFEKGHHVKPIIATSPSSSHSQQTTTATTNQMKHFIVSLFLFTSAMIGFVFTLSSFSSWNYVSVLATSFISTIILCSYTIYQLIIQFENERKRKQIYRIRRNRNKNYFISSPLSFSNNGMILNNNGQEEQEEDEENTSGNSKNVLLESLNGHTEKEENEEFDENDKFKKISIKEKIIFIIKDTISTIKYKPKLSIILIAISISIAIIIPVTLNGVCICSHPMTISTSFTRRLFQSSYCKDGDICFLYLTLPENPSNSMILQIHTYNKPINIEVTITSLALNETTTFSNSNNNNFISMSNIIKDEPRFIIYQNLIGLSPNTEYKLNVFIKTKEHGIISNTDKNIEYRFKTFPAESDKDDRILKFVSGGDIVLNKDSESLGKLSQKFKPDFLIVGGDVVYEDGIGSCYRRWDEKLTYFHKYFDQSTSNTTNDTITTTTIYHLTPILLSIGNHEAGAFFQTHKEVPFYFKYFLFSIGDNEIEENERKSYHIHKLNKHTSIVSLDSCVVSTWKDQVGWLDKKWGNNNDSYTNTNKLVVYHHPIYPSWNNLDGLIPKLGRESMVPLFDKYSVPFAFENHEHLFKRTKPLKNYQLVNITDINNNNNNKGYGGTIYVGDGSLGISPTNVKPIENDPQLPWYLSKRSYCNHLWFVTLDKKEIKIEAISPDGDKIDKVSYK